MTCALATIDNAASGGMASVVAKKQTVRSDPPVNFLIQTFVVTVSLSSVSVIIKRRTSVRLLSSLIKVVNSSLILFVIPIAPLLLGCLMGRLEHVVVSSN
jgi:hypothetical protein